MKNRILITGAVAVALAGCSDGFLGSRSANTLDVGAAFQSVPAGFSAATNSFDASGDTGPFFPGRMEGGMGTRSASMGPDGGGPGGPGGPGGAHKGAGEHRDGFGGPGLHGVLMGGGLGPDFLGRIPYGRKLGRGPFGYFVLPDVCTYSATTGIVTCPDKVNNGITVKSTFAFKDTAGVAQAKYDTTSTNSVNVKVTVTGSRTRKDSAVSVLNHASDRTVSGLAPGSTERTINGTASATETTTGVKDSIQFTAVRVASDTTTGLVIPIQDGKPTIPSAGVVIRNMTVTITPQGGTATTRSRREQITFDGTNVISVVITQNGETKNCTITLPSRKLICS
jgi:hypothetical protein